MDQSGKTYHYLEALEDFHRARRRARLETFAAWMSGKSTNMLQYDEIRRNLPITETAAVHLEDIPLSAIVGSVSREADFSRQLFPLNENDNIRWAKVKQAFESPSGLPPIDVYQVGEVYFILDGHHRASVARQMGATYIQAYVRKVQTPVALKPDDQIDDVILKAEHIKFLQTTNLNKIVKDLELRCTTPQGYDRLLEHISVHRYFMGIDEKREVSYADAVEHWYFQVYMPVFQAIRRDGLLADFPKSTEADLYLWIMDRRTELENELQWKVDTSTAIKDFAFRFSRRINRISSRIVSKLIDVVLPDPLEVSAPPGVWRTRFENSILAEGRPEKGVFQNVLLTVTGDKSGWAVLEHAFQIANREGSFIGGLYVGTGESNETGKALQAEFAHRCGLANVAGELAIENGNVTRLVYERSFWADLLVLRLSHPPPFLSVKRLGSGLRTLIRKCTTPILVVPPTASTHMGKALLAYGGGPKADEALYLSAYLANRWGVDLHVITIEKSGVDGNKLLDRARLYLSRHGAPSVHYHNSTGKPASVILDQCNQIGCDLIIMGGYEGGYFRELVLGSTVDRVLWKTHCPVLICH